MFMQKLFLRENIIQRYYINLYTLVNMTYYGQGAE